MHSIKNPLLVVVSAPSGAGKTTLCRMLLHEFRRMAPSVSCTTRARRKGEVDGRDYFFLAAAEFNKRLRRKAFLETASVHGHCYGTPRGPVVKALARGLDVLMAIDVQGARMIRNAVENGTDKSLKAAFVDIFVVPPSLNELKRRLLKRGQDNPEEISIRLKNAASEMRYWRDFRYVVVNDRLEQAYEEMRSIVIAEHCRNMINFK